MSEKITYKIIDHTQATVANKKKAKFIIEKAFKKQLVDNYFDSKFIILLDEKERGIIILQKYSMATYMDKFAVLPEFQNAGLGEALFEGALDIAKGKLFWRANPKNSINEWYFNLVKKNSGNYTNNNGWNIFWTNLRAEEISKCVEYAANKKETLM